MHFILPDTTRLWARALGDGVADLLPAAPPLGGDAARDAEWVRAAREDPDQFRALVEQYQTRVFATALRLVGDRSEARDVAQEAFLRAFQKLDRFQTGKAFGPWICAIAANVARDHLRSPFRRWFRVGAHAPEASTEGEAVDDDGEQEPALHAALLRLPTKLRAAVVLRYVSGLSVEQVAEALDINESAAKMRLKRGLEQLKRHLVP